MTAKKEKESITLAEAHKKRDELVAGGKDKRAAWNEVKKAYKVTRNRTASGTKKHGKGAAHGTLTVQVGNASVVCTSIKDAVDLLRQLGK